MAANPFDAFDADMTATAPAAVAVNPFDAFDAPKANPFDAFDRPAAPVVRDIPEFRAAPEQGMLSRLREKFSPLIGPTNNQRQRTEARTQGLLNSLPGMASALEQAPKNKVITEGFVPATFTPNVKILPTDEFQDGVRERSSVPMLEALASPNQEGDPTSLRFARAIYNPTAGALNSLASPGSMLTLGVGGELNAIARAGGPAYKLATGLNRAVIGGFSADMARNVAEKVPDVYDQVTDPSVSWTDKSRSITELAIPLTMAGIGGRALYKDIQVGGPLGKMALDSIRKTSRFRDFKGTDAELIKAVREFIPQEQAAPTAPRTERNVTPANERGGLLADVGPPKSEPLSLLDQPVAPRSSKAPVIDIAASPELVESLRAQRSGPSNLELIEANEGNVPVKIQSADGSIYEASMNGWQEIPAGVNEYQAVPSIGRATEGGISHGILRPGERIIGEVPSNADFQAYRNRIFQPETAEQVIAEQGITQRGAPAVETVPIGQRPSLSEQAILNEKMLAEQKAFIDEYLAEQKLAEQPESATTSTSITVGDPVAPASIPTRGMLGNLDMPLRGAAGGPVTAPGLGDLTQIGRNNEPAVPQQNTDLPSRMEYLRELLDTGEITKEEFLQQSDEAMAIAQQRSALSPEPIILPPPSTPTPPSAIAASPPPFNRSTNPYGIAVIPPSPPTVIGSTAGAGGGQPPVPPTTGVQLVPGGQGPTPSSSPKVPLTAFPGILERAYMDLKTKLVDFTAPIETLKPRFEKAYGYELPPTQDIVNAHDRVFASRGIAQMFLKDAGFMKLVQEVPDIETYGKYLIDRRALELDAAGIKETGVDLVKAGQNVAASRGQNQVLDQQTRDFSNAFLAKAVDYGLISAESAAYYADLYKDFAPIEREFDELELAAKRTGAGRGPSNLSKQTVIRKLEGSKRAIKNPLATWLKRTEDMITQGERNKAAEMLAGYRTLPGWNELIKEVPTNNHSSPYTFSYLDAGVKRTFATTKEIAEAAKALNVQQLGVLGQIAAVPMRLAKLGITGINLNFVLRNLPRDQQTVFINSRNPVAALANIPRAIFEAVGHGELYDTMMREGAIHSSFDIARNNPLPTLEKIRSQKDLKSRALYTATHPAEYLRTIENVMNRGEEMTRIQQFITAFDVAIKEGNPVPDAIIIGARAARENSANFMRMGALGPVMGALALYLRAGIQGSRARVRALKRDPLGTTTKLAIAMLAEATLVAWNLGDEKRKKAYADLQQSERENNHIFVPPDPVMDEKGQWNIVKMPKDQGAANLSTMIRRPMEEAYGLEPVKFKEMVNALIGTVSPVEPSAQSLLSNAAPQLIKPLSEIALNKNFFTGGPIIPDNLLRFSPERQYDRNTSGASIWLGKQLGVSPKNIDHAIKGYFGGLGPQVQNTLDQSIASISGDKQWQSGTRSVFEDISRSFTKGQGGDNLRRFYEAQTASDQALNTYIRYKRDGDFEQADKFYSEHKNEIHNAHSLSVARSQLQKINKQINDSEAKGDNDMTAKLRLKKAEIAGDAYQKLTERSKPVGKK